MYSASHLEAECTVIKEYLKKESEALISLILEKKEREKQAIREKFQSMYNISLEDQINKDLNGNFRRTIIDLFRTKPERDAIYLFKALKGPIIHQDTVIEILCSRSNNEIIKIKEEFSAKYPKEESLEEKVQHKMDVSIRDILIKILGCQRSENPIPVEDHCKSLVKDLFDENTKELTTYELALEEVFAKCSPPELYRVNELYFSTYQKQLKSDIEKVFKGHKREGLMTILEALTSPSEYFAKRINKAVKGLGTDDKMLIRVLTTRQGVDMPEMRKCYKNLFGKDMVDDIKDDTSGKYQSIVVALASGD